METRAIRIHVETAQDARGCTWGGSGASVRGGTRASCAVVGSQPQEPSNYNPELNWVMRHLASNYSRIAAVQILIPTLLPPSLPPSLPRWTPVQATIYCPGFAKAAAVVVELGIMVKRRDFSEYSTYSWPGLWRLWSESHRWHYTMFNYTHQSP